MEGRNGFQVRPFCLGFLICFNCLQGYCEYFRGISMKDLKNKLNLGHKVLLLLPVSNFNNS